MDAKDVERLEKAKELLSLCDSEQDDHSADFVLWACEASANTQVLVQELLEKHWQMKCDMCGDDENVGFAGCEHEECKTIKVCDFCDVDGSNYNGWCIDEQEPVSPIVLTRREAKTLYAVLNVWCKCRERVLDAHNLYAFGYEDIDNVINKCESVVKEVE